MLQCANYPQDIFESSLIQTIPEIAQQSSLLAVTILRESYIERVLHDRLGCVSPDVRRLKSIDVGGANHT